MSKKGSPSSYPRDPSYQYQYQYAIPSAPMAPPPYSQYPPIYAAGVPGPSQPYPQASPNMMVGPSPMAPNPAYLGQAHYHMPMGPPIAQFDSGARFDGVAGMNVPPPPPGVAPNAAQHAMAYGAPVATTQQKSNWFTGGNGGGMSFW